MSSTLRGSEIFSVQVRELVDAVIGHEFFGDALKASGFRFPKDFAFLALDKQGSDVGMTSYAGATHDDLGTARLAIVSLNDQITNGLSGIPSSLKTVLLDTYWTDGDTL